MSIFSRNNGEEGNSELEEHHKQEVHRSALHQMPNDDSVDKEYLRELTRNEIDDDTLFLLQNLMTQDYVLSNLSEAEITEVKWLGYSIGRKTKRMHPDEDSLIQGRVRKAALDDEDDALRALSPHKENLLDQGLVDYFTKPPRSKKGWQQDEISKQVRVSKTEDDSGEESRGLFGRL